MHFSNWLYPQVTSSYLARFLFSIDFLFFVFIFLLHNIFGMEWYNTCPNLIILFPLFIVALSCTTFSLSNIFYSLHSNINFDYPILFIIFVCYISLSFHVKNVTFVHDIYFFLHSSHLNAAFLSFASLRFRPTHFKCCHW